jgi:hypothetical protein
MKFYASVSQNGLKLLSKATDEVLSELPVIPATEQHRAFILATWVRSYESSARKLQLAGMRIPQDVYRLGESQLSESKWALCRVVVSKDDEYTIHGWVCGEPGRLWHVYVPPNLRGSGVAKGLVESVCGKEYVVHKPWPSTPRSHTVSWSPYA